MAVDLSREIHEVSSVKSLVKGKPLERMGRKATGLSFAVFNDKVAGLPGDTTSRVSCISLWQEI